MWRIAPSVSAALLLLVWSFFCLSLAESGNQRAAEDLGYSGSTVRIIAVGASTDAETARFNTVFSSFIADQDLSVAYSRSYESGLVTLIDVRERFAIGLDKPFDEDVPDATRRAVLRSQTPGLEAWFTRQDRFDGMSISTAPLRDVMFEDRYPLAILSASAQPFSAGVYLIAGLDESKIQPLLNLYEQSGMMIADVSTHPGTGPMELLANSFKSPYGVIASAFAGIASVASFLVAGTFVSLRRDRLHIAAALGASRLTLMGITIRQLAAPILIGTSIGLMLSGALCIAIAPLTLMSPTDVVSSIGFSVALSASTWVFAVAVVAYHERRVSSRVVPS